MAIKLEATHIVTAEQARVISKIVRVSLEASNFCSACMECGRDRISPEALLSQQRELILAIVTLWPQGARQCVDEISRLVVSLGGEADIMTMQMADYFNPPDPSKVN